MNAISVMCCLLLVACQAHLELGADVQIACEREDDCPGDRVCQLSRKLCVRRGADDNTPPNVSQVTSLNQEAIRVSFSEAIEVGTIALATAYAIEPALEIRAVVVEDEQSVLLSVSRQSAGVTYTLTVTGVQDLAGNITAAPGDAVTFTGVGPVADAFTPDPLLPVTGAVIYTSEATLTWTPRELATHYEVNVARDAAFTDQIASSPFTVETPSLTLTGLEARTYYWRVRADATEAGKYGESTFDVVIDRVRVYCDADPCGTEGVGNLSKPLRRIARAVLVAAANGLPRVDIAMRPNGQPYLESLNLAPGVSLYGGYSADFNEATRDPVTARTAILGAGAKAVAAINIKNAPLRVEALRIEGSTQIYSQALAIYDCDDSITVSHCDLVGATGSGVTGTGLNLDRMAGALPLIEDSVIQGGVGYENSYAINITFSSAHLSRNRIIGRTATETSFGIHADTDPTLRGIGRWTNNIIEGGTALFSGGADLNQAQIVTNNVIKGGDTAVRINLRGASLTNNILSSAQTCLTRTRSDGQPQLASWHNNVLADCTGKGAACFGATCVSLTSGLLDDPTSMLGASAAGTAISGNLNGSTSAALFEAPGDYHLSPSSVAATSGREASEDVCGVTGTTSCGPVVDDFERHPRSVPFASGAYEP